jgi:hypothetical protein
MSEPVYVEVGGESRPLAFNLRAIAGFQRETGSALISAFQEISKLDSGDSGADFDRISTVLWAFFYGADKSITKDDVEGFVGLRDMRPVIEAIHKCVEGVMGEEEGVEPAPLAKKKRGRPPKQSGSASNASPDKTSD